MIRFKKVHLNLLWSAIGVVFLSFAAQAYISTLNFYWSSIEGDGVVIKIEERSDETTGIEASTNYFYHPIVEFTDEQKTMYTFTSSTGFSSPDAYSIGDSVDVRYNPLVPSEAKIYSISDFWFVPIVLSFLGIGFFLGGILFLMEETNPDFKLRWSLKK